MVLDAKCLEFCGLPYMVLPCLEAEHINRSWMLLRAFGPHGLLRFSPFHKTTPYLFNHSMC